MYRELVGNIAAFVFTTVLAAINLVLVGQSENVWVNILNIVGFVLCAIVLCFIYRHIVRFAEMIDEDYETLWETMDNTVEALKCMSEDLRKIEDTDCDDCDDDENTIVGFPIGQN